MNMNIKEVYKDLKEKVDKRDFTLKIIKFEKTDYAKDNNIPSIVMIEIDKDLKYIKRLIDTKILKQLHGIKDTKQPGGNIYNFGENYGVMIGWKKRTPSIEFVVPLDLANKFYLAYLNENTNSMEEISLADIFHILSLSGPEHNGKTDFATSFDAKVKQDKNEYLLELFKNFWLMQLKIDEVNILHLILNWNHKDLTDNVIDNLKIG